MKVALIGTGRVGSAAAFCMLPNQKITELILVNRTREKAEGLKMDLAAAFPQFGVKISVGGADEAGDADVVVFTSGFFGAPAGKSMLDVNKPVVEEFFKDFEPKKKCKVVITTTPIDQLAKVALELTGLEKKNVMGFGGQLDANRLRYLVMRSRNDYSLNFEAHYIGEHGKRGIPIFRERVLERQGVIEETKNYFGKHLAKSGASTYATAAEITKLVDALLSEEGAVLDVSHYNGAKKIFITWPCIVNKDGARPIDLELSEEERKAYEALVAMRIDEETG